MRKFLKSKTLKILVCCTLIFTFVFSFLSVSAVEPIYTGGATITIISGNFTIADGSSTVSADIDNMGDGSFRINSTGSLKSGYEYATNCTFYFSADNNYGTLKVSVRQAFGTPYQSAYNRIYDAVNETNLGASVSYPYNTVSFTYTGYIPSSIRIASYFVASSTNGLTSYYDWSFTPIDKATNDIIDNQNQNAQAIQDNQDKNTSQILNGWENDSPAESGDIGNLDELESGLIDDANNQADSHRVNINDSVIGSIQRLTSSFGAVSALFQDITLGTIPDISVLIYFSIFIGLVPLIVGLSVQGLRARDRSDKLKSRKGKKGD